MAFGLKISGAKKTSLKRIISAATFVTIFVYVFTIGFAALLSIDVLPVFGFVFLFSLFIINVLFDLSLGKSLIVWICCFAGQVLAVVICAELFIGGINDLLNII